MSNGARTAALPLRLERLAPGLPILLHYKRADLPHDLLAGLSVAAVALPVGVAYAQLAGFAPAVGLYASILPLVAYALFGTSRQLIVGPDAATCALVAASVAPLAAGDAKLYLSLSITLAFLAGLVCIAGSFLKLGALADFLSRPILVGFMNGIALSIILGQIGKLFGFPIHSGGIVSRLLELTRHPDATTNPGLVVFRFNGPIVFFNAAHFKRQALAAAQAEGSSLKWFVLDMLPVTMMDATGIYTLNELVDALHARGVTVALAGRLTQWANWAARTRGLLVEDLRVLTFPTLRQAVKAFRTQAGMPSPEADGSPAEEA